MDVIINSAEICGQVCAVSSKALVHRMLICASLAGEHTDLVCPDVSDDMNATAQCLRALGMNIRRTKYGFEVDTCDSCGDSAELDCHESGATLRFLLPVACALGVEASFVRHNSLKKRPIDGLISALSGHGCSFTETTGRIKCRGRLEPGEFVVDASISSQFVSGLMLALPLLHGDSRIVLVGNPVSSPYIRMTEMVLSLFGVKVERGDGYIDVKGNQHYRSCGKIDVEGDWSNAAVWLCAGAIGLHPVSVSGLRSDSLQGDRAVADILRAFGANVTEKNGVYTVSPASLRATEIDASDIPDIIPPLCVVAAVAKGTTVIRNAGHLRSKESNRLRAIEQTLSALGARIYADGDSLVITGVERLTGGSVQSFADHRIVMTCALAAVASDEPVVIFGAESVTKSYPGFFRDFEALGADVTERGE